MSLFSKPCAFLLLSATLFMGCAGTDGTNPEPEHNHDEEVITTVELTFEPGGLVFTAADPEDDGDPVIDGIVLDADTAYTFSVRFINELEDPPENITEEIEEEDDEHQVLYSGAGVASAGDSADALAAAVGTHSYADEDDNGNPVGLSNNFVTAAPGTGDLRVLLRHLPPEDGTATKTATLAEDFAANGLTGLPGTTDADVTFPVEVQ